LKPKVLTALLAATLLAFTPSAIAAKKPTPKPVIKVAPKSIKVTLAKPDVVTKLSGADGDQVANALISPTSLFLIGTVESSTVGGSDGYVASYDFTGKKNWELHLGGQPDEIATAAMMDKTGNLWIVGSQSGVVTSQLPVTDTQSINVDSVNTTPTFNPGSSLTQLTLWKVSDSGQLLATYAIECGGLVVPNSISQSATGVVIAGLLNEQYFNINSDLLGNFGKLSKSSAKPTATTSALLKVGTGTLRSYISSAPIAGISTWKPKAPTPVLIQRTKSGTVIRANYFQGKVISVFYKSGVGPVVVTERADGYGLFFLGLV
jgi:hypothetical protein